MQLTRSLILVVLFLFSTGISNGQVTVDKLMKYGQEVKPEIIDNYHYSIYYTNNKNAYNLKGFKIANLSGKLQSIKVNPAGYSYAALSGKNEKTKVTILALNSNSEKREVKGLISPSAICYSPDSRHLYIADVGQIKIYDSKNLESQRSFNVPGERPVELTASLNGYFLAIAFPDKVDIYNISTGQLRHSLSMSKLNSVAFTPSSEKIGLLSNDGKLAIYNTADFNLDNLFEYLGSNTSNVFFHPDENYVGFVVDNNRIQFINLFEPNDRPSVYDAGTTSARFVHDDRNNQYLANISGNNIFYRQLGGFSMNYTLLISQRVDDLLAEWTKMRPGETEAEYRQRVNEESIRKQKEIFAQQEASKFALTAGLGNFGTVTLGRYNPSDGTLIVSLGNMQEIYLKVPIEDMAGFGDGNNLEFKNHVFMVTPSNTFDLIYVEVFNPTNGKSYIFDNMAGQNLDFLNTNDGFVSLDLIRQSSRQDIILQDIKDKIVKEAKAADRLSDHTLLKVDTRIEQTVDPEGRHIRNYLVDFAYEVDEIGSATEDFAPGKYKIKESHAAESMLQIIRQAFLSEFAGYIVPGKKIIIHITGSADALPINGVIAYDGAFGEFSDEPCRVNGALTSLSVNKSKGIKTNEELGFMRAQAVQKELMELVPELESMKVEYRHNIIVAKEKGAQFRRINVSLEFIDAF